MTFDEWKNEIHSQQYNRERAHALACALTELYKPGERVSPPEIRKRFAVSENVTAPALMRLKAQGLVARVQGRLLRTEK